MEDEEKDLDDLLNIAKKKLNRIDRKEDRDPAMEQDRKVCLDCLLNNKHCPYGNAKEHHKIQCDEYLPDVSKDLMVNPKLLHFISESLNAEITGEHRNKMVVFLICMSSRLRNADYSLGGVLTGESAGGKSYMLAGVTSYFPEEDIKWFSRVTPSALNYLQDENLTGKILIIEEIEGLGDNPQMRVLLSEKGLRLLTVKRSSGDKAYEPNIIEVKGCPAFLTCTTRQYTEEQLETRVFRLTPDESEEQTRRIYQFQALKEDVLEERWSYHKLLLKAFIQRLDPYPVVVPFARELADKFPSKRIRGRRDFKKLLGVIKIIAWIHQAQRFRINGHVIATVADLKYALEILEGIFEQTFSGVVPRARELYEQIIERGEVNVPDLATEFDMVQRTVRKYVNNLTGAGLLVKDDSKRPHSYRIKKGAETVFSGIAELTVDFNEKEYLDGLKSLTEYYPFDTQTEHYEPPEHLSLYSEVTMPFIKRSTHKPRSEQKKLLDTVVPFDTAQEDRIKEFIQSLILISKREDAKIEKETFKKTAKESNIPKDLLKKILMDYTTPHEDGVHLIVKSSIEQLKITGVRNQVE